MANRSVPVVTPVLCGMCSKWHLLVWQVMVEGRDCDEWMLVDAGMSIECAATLAPATLYLVFFFHQ